MSMTFAIDAGIASYVGAGAMATEDGAGRDAARAAAIDVAAIFFVLKDWMESVRVVQLTKAFDK
jgi:hypothetical protein